MIYFCTDVHLYSNHVEQAKEQLKRKAEEGNVAAMTKLYNMSPKSKDKRVKVVVKEDNTDKIVDIEARMKGK